MATGTLRADGAMPRAAPPRNAISDNAASAHAPACRGDAGGSRADASAEPRGVSADARAAAAQQGDAAPTWAPFGACNLLRTKHGTVEAVCPLVAQAAAGALPRWTLSATLTVLDATSGADLAAALTPLLPRWERVAVLLRPAPSADAAARAAFAKLARALQNSGKAARCKAAATGGRDAYLVPPGAFADAQLAAVGAPAALAAAEPALFAFVLAPKPCAAQAASHAAPAATPPAVACAASAPPPQHPSGCNADDSPGCAVAAVAVGAALRAAARAALLAADDPSVRGVQQLRVLAASVSRAASPGGHRAPPSTQELRAALAAAPQDFELVTQFKADGQSDVAVYLLQASPDGGGRTRVTQPAAQTPEEAAYTQRLLAWLRQQGRWCCQAEVLACVPLPDAQHTHVFLRSCAAQQPDAVAVARAWRCIAALRDGAPPGPQPKEQEMRELEHRWRTRQAPSAELPWTTATTAQRRSGSQPSSRGRTPPTDAAAWGVAGATLAAPPPPSRPYETVLQAAARTALMDTSQRGVLRLGALAVRLGRERAEYGIKGQPSADELHAALAAAPQDFELVNQFWNGERTVAVYLLQEAPHGGRTRVALPPAQTPEEAAYAQRLLAWLREQARWCCEAEVMACVPPTDPSLSIGFMRACAARHPDAVAAMHSWRCLAAMRDGALPPGAPPNMQQLRELERRWQKTATELQRAAVAAPQHRSDGQPRSRSRTPEDDALHASLTTTHPEDLQDDAWQPERDDAAAAGAAGEPTGSRKRGRSPSAERLPVAMLNWIVQRDALARTLQFLVGKRYATIEEVHAGACAGILPLPDLRVLLSCNSHLFHVARDGSVCALQQLLQPCSSDTPAALQAAARTVLEDATAGSVPRTLSLRAVTHAVMAMRQAGLAHAVARVSVPPDAMRAALAAAPRDFELAPRFWDGTPDATVYLLQEGPGSTRTRVAQPLAQTPEEAAYTQRLLAWLRQQNRWCTESEALAAVPSPDASHLFLRSCLARQHDFLARSDGWAHLAALRDGAPPGPPPACVHEQQ